MELCLRCGKNETCKLVDGVPICSECMLKDAAENKGRVIDYSGLKPKSPKRAPAASKNSTPGKAKKR